MTEFIKCNEKFLSFMALLGAVLILVWWALSNPPEKDQVIRLLDGALGGLLLAFGGAANALFRIGTPEDQKLKAATAEVLTTQARDEERRSPMPVVIDTTNQEAIPTKEEDNAPTGGSTEVEHDNSGGPGSTDPLGDINSPDSGDVPSNAPFSNKR